MTITRTERDWLNALWVQATRDADHARDTAMLEAFRQINQSQRRSPFPLPRWEP